MNYRFKQPSPGMLVLEPFAEPTMTAGGLHLPDTAVREGAVTAGKILMINPPPGDDPDDYFKVGDIVIVGKWSGTEVWLGHRQNKKRYIIINEDSVLATMEPEDDDTISATTGSTASA